MTFTCPDQCPHILQDPQEIAHGAARKPTRQSRRAVSKASESGLVLGHVSVHE
jgi:hypothetical protein